MSGGVVARRRYVVGIWCWWAVGLALVAGTTVADIVAPLGNLSQTTYLLVVVGAGVAGVMGARRQPPERRFAWMCVGIGVALSAVGDTNFFLKLVITGTPYDVSIGDAFWLSAYLALAIGLSSLVVGGRGLRRVDVDGLTDIGSFTVLAVLLVTRLDSVRGLITDTSYSLAERSIWTAYPILDAALLAVVLHAMFGRRLRGRGGVCLGFGAALWLMADFLSLLNANMSMVSVWADLGWMLGAMGLAASTWPHESREDHAEIAVPAVSRVTDARLVITFVPLLVPEAIDIYEHAHGHNADPVVLFGFTLALGVLAFVRSARLIKSRDRQEAALERSTHYFAALAENSSDAMVVIDYEGRILNESPTLAEMLGRPGFATTGVDAIDLLSPPDPDAARHALDRWWQTAGPIADGEIRATRADGTQKWFGLRAANLSHDPIVGGMVVNLRDITDRKRAEAELSHNAFHDTLTGLPNRALFHDRLEHALTRTARTGLDVAVVYLDLDGFKMINDTSGHEAGDRVLVEVAARLSEAVRSSDTVARLGGDEFAVLIEESPSALDEAKIVAERVLHALTSPFAVDMQMVVLSASIGISVGNVMCTPSSMLREADVAMYRSKTNGRGTWSVYEPEMGVAALERLELESDLRLALDQQQFRLAYQPIVELDTTTVVGFEALLRWDHPTLGEIQPDTFIPIMENNGTIVQIGYWVLKEACRTAARWSRLHPDVALTMAVNLSARQISTCDIVGQVSDALRHSGLPAESLVLELTESSLMHDAEAAARRLHELRKLGVRLAIDDFGTGYSSLSYLRQFPIDILKIDRSFVNSITNKAATPAIVRGLFDLAKTLHMETIAEGIELDVQYERLRHLRCQYGQGFLFSKPLTAAAADALVAELGSIDDQPQFASR